MTLPAFIGCLVIPTHLQHTVKILFKEIILAFNDLCCLECVCYCLCSLTKCHPDASTCVSLVLHMEPVSRSYLFFLCMFYTCLLLPLLVIHTITVQPQPPWTCTIVVIFVLVFCCLLLLCFKAFSTLQRGWFSFGCKPNVSASLLKIHFHGFLLCWSSKSLMCHIKSSVIWPSFLHP